jgi:hypothetical protein
LCFRVYDDEVYDAYRNKFSLFLPSLLLPLYVIQKLRNKIEACSDEIIIDRELGEREKAKKQSGLRNGIMSYW